MELARAHELLLVFTWRLIGVQYKQAVLGVGWALLSPLMSTLVYTFVFGKLAAIPPGASVNLSLSVDQQTALGIDAQGEHLGGCGGSEVKSISIGNNTITFDDKGCADVAGKTFTVASDAFILIDGKMGKLDEIPTGANVNVTLSVDQQTVRQVRAGGRRLAGVVNAVDAEKISAAYDAGVLRVTVPLQERALPRKIEVSAGARAAVEA